MTELEYVLAGFEKKLAVLKGKKILLHGSREYARAIMETFQKDFNFLGVMTEDPVEEAFCGLPVYPKETLSTLRPEAVLLTERVKYAQAVYEAIAPFCEANGILLYNMYGVDEIAAHRRIEESCQKTAKAWEELCFSYDVVAFEAMDTLLHHNPATDEVQLRPIFLRIILLLLRSKIPVLFSLRKSFPEGKQIEALSREGIVWDPEKQIIRREGEDLSFRRIREAYPGKRILYIGIGLINECLLPLCYDIDTYRFSDEYQPVVFHMPVVSKTHKAPTPAGSLREELLNKIQKSDLISFDIFDTLVVRKTLIPEDVFALMAKRFEMSGEPLEDFVERRKKAGEQFPCTTLEEIYGRLQEQYSWTNAQTQKVMDAEIAVEKEVIVPRTEVAALLSYAVRLGKRVVLTTDMYLSRSVLLDILQHCGIEGFEALLISCEEGKEKKSGLFEKLKALAGPTDTILHIGDNQEADTAMEASLGIEAFLLPAPLSMAVERGFRDSLLMAETLMERLLLGTVFADIFRDPFQTPDLPGRTREERLHRFAVSVLGPLTIGFMTWLKERIEAGKYEGVLFLARDGAFPMKVYEEIRKSWALPPAIYYYASRHAAFLCVADEEETIDRILSLCRYTGLPVEKALSTVYTLPCEDIQPPFKDEDEKAYILRHWEKICRVAQQAREGYLAYSKRVGLKPGQCYAVMDCVAAGATQWFLESWMPYRFEGFYLGNHTPEERKSPHITDYLSFLNKSLLKNYIEIESFFTSKEPTLDTLTPEGTPVFGEETRSSKELEELDKVHLDAFALAKDFFHHFYFDGEVISPHLPEEMYAAEGYHFVQQEIYDDWTKTKIPTKEWEV